MTTPNLLTQLQDADMLLIDGLHAWQFELSEAPAQLRVECMDGRERRVWVFAAAALAAASHDAATDCWRIEGADGQHELVILSGITASNDDDGEDEPAANDETPAD
ncbi:conserved hypothetical protein [Pseudomonas sp. 8AS]|uniref:DUF5629 family protein n=1 Tax=Pseudomonas sp. 8AS TaxID=2653163 RepID=UPI0012F2EE13|nr:DUF5629 family protein [Pseudomonas sp. 8AS]VXC43167.1 conserved hypothetical protein [Pseudomonas sp. 8AS]